jgi:hypothetical protein
VPLGRDFSVFMFGPFESVNQPWKTSWKTSPTFGTGPCSRILATLTTSRASTPYHSCCSRLPRQCHKDCLLRLGSNLHRDMARSPQRCCAAGSACPPYSACIPCLCRKCRPLRCRRTGFPSRPESHLRTDMPRPSGIHAKLCSTVSVPCLLTFHFLPSNYEDTFGTAGNGFPASRFPTKSATKSAKGPMSSPTLAFSRAVT